MKDYYAIIGASPTDSQEAIRKAYLRLAKEYHPDGLPRRRAKLTKLAEEKFKEIQQAYEVLGNPGKRLAYDCGRDPHLPATAKISPKQAAIMLWMIFSLSLVLASTYIYSAFHRFKEAGLGDVLLIVGVALLLFLLPVGVIAYALKHHRHQRIKRS